MASKQPLFRAEMLEALLLAIGKPHPRNRNDLAFRDSTVALQLTGDDSGDMIARPGRMPINGDVDRAAVLVCDDKEDRPLLFFAVAGHRPQSFQNPLNRSGASSVCRTYC
jgi:hypothetical protein